MSVLVDTPVWSLALRRRTVDLSYGEKSIVSAFGKLIQQGQVELLGLVRQEILSGIREESRFQTIRTRLRAFPDVSLIADDFEDAASLSNQCRREGIASSTVDMLICAVALRRGWQIFTTDRDFVHYAKATQVRIFPLP